MSTFESVQDDNEIWATNVAEVTKRHNNYRDEARRIKLEHFRYERDSEMLEESADSMKSDVRNIVEDLEELRHRKKVFEELATEAFGTVISEAKDLGKENDQNNKLLDSLRKELNFLKIEQLKNNEGSSYDENTFYDEKGNVIAYKSVSANFAGNEDIDALSENIEGKDDVFVGKQKSAEHERSKNVFQTSILQGDVDKLKKPISKVSADVNKDKCNKFICARPLYIPREEQKIDPRKNKYDMNNVTVGGVSMLGFGCDNSQRRPNESLILRKTQFYESIRNRTKTIQVNRRKQADLGLEITAQIGNHVQQKLGKDMVILAKTCRKEDELTVSTPSKVEFVHSRYIPAITSTIENKHDKVKFSKRSTTATDSARDIGDQITEGSLSLGLTSVESQKTTKRPLPPIASKNTKRGIKERCKMVSVVVEDALPSITPIKVDSDRNVTYVVPLSSPRPVYISQHGEKFETQTTHKTAKPSVKLSNSDRKTTEKRSKRGGTTMKRLNRR